MLTIIRELHPLIDFFYPLEIAQDKQERYQQQPAYLVVIERIRQQQNGKPGAVKYDAQPRLILVMPPQQIQTSQQKNTQYQVAPVPSEFKLFQSDVAEKRSISRPTNGALWKQKEYDSRYNIECTHLGVFFRL